MMRGPTYDDGYITRKMSSLHGPTFAPPGGVGSYGRPPMGGYMQQTEKKEEKASYTAIELKESEEQKKRRAVSPSVPYFWPEKETSNMDRKKGWYRVDFGPQRVTQMWYLPTVKDRLNFLNRHKDASPHEPFETPSPFPVEDDDKPRSSEYWKVQRQHFPTTTRERRRSKPLICLGNLPMSVPRIRSSSVAPNPYSQIPRPGLRPSISYEPARSLSQPPTGAASAPGRVTSYWSVHVSPPQYSLHLPSLPVRRILRRVGRQVAYAGGYPPMGPPPRMVPRMGPPPPSYYDYDYGYGGGYGGYGGYGYGYPPPPPRMSRYDTYLDEDLPEHTYTPRHRSRIPDTLNDMDIRDKIVSSTTSTSTTTPTKVTSYNRSKSPTCGAHHHHHHHHQALVPMPPSVAALRDLPPMSVNDVDDSYLEQPRRLRKAHLQSSPGIEPPAHLHVPGETEGDRHLAKLQARYPSLSEPQMLQDHVDNMRIRLKSIAFSLDPSGPVPDIIVPERKKAGAAADGDKAYTKGPRHFACVEFAGGQPLWRRRARARYPSDDPESVTRQTEETLKNQEEKPEKDKEKLILRDRLSNRIHQFFNETMTADQFGKYLKNYRNPENKPPPLKHYWKPKQYNPDDFKVPSDTSSRYDKLAGAKWEEPDTVFGAPAPDKKPFSKPLTDGTSEESDEKKERRKKKKSKERELPETPAIESSTTAALASTPAPTSELSTSEVESAAKEASSITEDMDEKELKKLEKKKRKAEREAAAKAAMEAELAALAAAEAELARLEAESSNLKTDSPAPAPVEVPAKVEVPSPAPAAAEEPTPSPAPAPAPAEPATEVKSESAADKSGEPSKAAKKLQSATNKIMAVGAFLRNVTQKKSPAE
ncbi:histone-lysine N-methyltransferase SETD1A-like isoform X32 [Macrobrachium rosenbergii]|uniref:histone-lysine N-methyltransferase SETD1A-like isoform X32 n=1 Tax=Macrobrachium rosenbergii TaxID=79674 RepID=UPI0034D59B6E